mmetsp:Transcript_3257/g.5046  ORF Transcript_3257/g.5046 Transcript_3257/m.5046 type:complete len:189 (-) Transcript_3257:55-621(-)
MVTRTVTEKTMPLAAALATERTATRAREIMVPILAKSLTHSLVASLSETMTHSPLQDYYCYYCATKKEYCEYCQASSSQRYYAMYYAGYYSSWYSGLYHSQYVGRGASAYGQGGGIKSAIRKDEQYLDELRYRTEKGRAYRPTDRADVYAHDKAEPNHYRLFNSLKDKKKYTGPFFFANNDTRLADAY